MAEFPYTPSPANLTRFFAHIQSAGVPEKVSAKYLKQVGFKSSNDTYIPRVLKFVGFVDGSSVPTSAWQAYRSRNTAKASFAAAIRQAYADLFKTFPDAQRKDNEALRNYFSAHTKVAESTLGLIVATFKKLCELADFESAAPSEAARVAHVPTKGTAAATPSSTPPKPPAQIPTVNINIQLQLPATEDAAIYVSFQNDGTPAGPVLQNHSPPVS